MGKRTNKLIIIALDDRVTMIKTLTIMAISLIQLLRNELKTKTTKANKNIKPKYVLCP